LIYGETGTGKEIFAQAMIQNSGIPRKKVVIQNCAAVPENLIESILFGTTRGAYTGAENKKGLFEEANGGILFLDESNSMPYHVQGKLLRVLQDGSFRPIGANSERSVDVKIIAVINLDPMTAIKNKTLRDDLFYRFSSSVIHLTPLRERREDISYYVDYYIREFNKIYNRNIAGISDELRRTLTDYRWDGNVRELRHMIESMVGTAKDRILDVQHLPAYMYDCIYGKEKADGGEEDHIVQFSERLSEDPLSYNLLEALRNTEINLIKKALQTSKWNRTKASGLLGIPRQTLKYKIDKYNITK
jgi:arginine utilization regulatory protein